MSDPMAGRTGTKHNEKCMTRDEAIDLFVDELRRRGVLTHEIPQSKMLEISNSLSFSFPRYKNFISRASFSRFCNLVKTMMKKVLEEK